MKTYVSSLLFAVSTLFASGNALSAPIPNIVKEGCVVAQNTVCLESGTKTINGKEETRDCWTAQTTYYCEGKTDTSSCDYYAAKGCNLKSTQDVCVDQKNGKCIAYERKYTCDTGNSSSASQQSCQSIAYCETDANGKQNCYDIAYSPDQDMIPVVTLLEAGRQAGTYNDTSFFKGDTLRCREGKFGVGQSCCIITKTPKGRNNEKGTANSVMMSAAWQGAKYGFQYVKAWASPYVSDAIMVAKSWLTGGASAAAGSAAAAGGAAAVSTGINVSYMGFGYATAGAAPAGSVAIGNAGFYFNPAAFAVAVAIYVIMEVMMCSPSDEENKLGMLRGSNLCHDLGTYCSKDSILGCVQRKRTFCCWNSTLAKIVGIEGRKQIGKSFGSAKNPDCSGFTLDEFRKLDLSKMDFREFYAEVNTNTLGIEGSGVAKEDQNFWEKRAETRVNMIDSSTLKGSYNDNRESMKYNINKDSTKALENIDTQYEQGNKPVGGQNMNEMDQIKSDPYYKK